MQLHRCFVVRIHVNRQTKKSCEGSRIRNLRPIVLRRFLGVSRRKNNRKRDENARSHVEGAASNTPAPEAAMANAPCAPASNPMRPATTKMDSLLVFQVGSVPKAKKKFS
ncbi:hypothetical protein MTR_5g061805 [Medicago truncatula]|uniref:Uncharacterized protein n=1 Tax=Medicago truncatula TaxID=3880 RepID=A0A072UQC5_MEDTR|nr:hypothetical protein MTR_5g061805 [Medicago truncatula]